LEGLGSCTAFNWQDERVSSRHTLIPYPTTSHLSIGITFKQETPSKSGISKQTYLMPRFLSFSTNSLEAKHLNKGSNNKA